MFSKLSFYNVIIKVIMTTFDKAFNIFRKSKLLINAINDFVLFRYFKVPYVKKNYTQI